MKRPELIDKDQFRRFHSKMGNEPVRSLLSSLERDFGEIVRDVQKHLAMNHFDLAADMIDTTADMASRMGLQEFAVSCAEFKWRFAAEDAPPQAEFCDLKQLLSDSIKEVMKPI